MNERKIKETVYMRSSFDNKKRILSFRLSDDTIEKFKISPKRARKLIMQILRDEFNNL